MKRPKSKFNKLYEKGGLFDKSPGAPTGLQAGLGVTAGVLGSLEPEIGDPRFLGDEEYEQDISKTQKLNKTLSTAENAAISSGNPIAMGIGAGVKGVRLGLRALGVGRGKEEEAAAKAANRQTNRSLLDNATRGAINKNLLPTYSAPAYGARGMKFKTKFKTNFVK